MTSGDNAEALDLARKFVTELEAVQRDVKSNTQRITFWSVADLTRHGRHAHGGWHLSFDADHSRCAVGHDRDAEIIYRPLWVGGIIDAALVVSAVLLWQFGELTRGA